MQDNSANSRDFNPMSVAGLSDEARQAVNTAFDALSAWRIDIANSNEKSGSSCSGAGLAGANRGCHPRAASEHHENADPNDRSDDGYLGGADQITKPDDRLVGNAVEAKILARR